LILGVLAVDPRRALAHHRGVHVGAVHEHPPHGAPVAVGVLHLDARGFAEREIGQRLFGAAAVGLAGFGRVDLGQPHPHLAVAFSQQRQGVAVRNPDHAPGKGFGTDTQGTKNRDKQDQKPSSQRH
jgi:hypothetical protein